MAALVRIGLVDRQGLWVDEVFSLALATGHSLEHPAVEANPALGDYVEMPVALPALFYQRYLQHDDPPAGPGRVIRAVRLSDTNPPLYYLLLNAWTRWLGTSDAALRWFSVLCALACFPVLVVLAHRVGGSPAPLPACILFAASPVALFYSTDGRMYSLIWFLSASLLVLTLESSRRGPEVRLLALWVLVGTAGLLTHYFYAFVWIACVGWLALNPGRLGRGAVWAAGLSTVLMILPWYALVPETLARWRVTGDWLYDFPGWRRTFLSPFELGWSLLSGRGRWGGSLWAEWLLAAAFAVAALALWRRISVRVFSSRRALLWLGLLAVCLGPSVLDLARGSQTAQIPRYALAGMPAATVLAALMVSRLRAGPRFGVLLLILVAWSSGAWAVVMNESRNLHPFRQIGASLGASTDGSVLVLVHSTPSGVLGVGRYLHEDTSMASWVGQLDQRRVPADIEAFTAGRARVVLVKIHAVGAPAPEESWLREHAMLVSDVWRERAQIVSFAPRDGGRFVWTRATAR